MRRYCPNCGTEVDETAIFCPTCGSPIDQEAETSLPPAPGWPEPDDAPPPEPTAAQEPPAFRERVEPAVGPDAPYGEESLRDREADLGPTFEEPTQVERRPVIEATPPPVSPAPTAQPVPAASVSAVPARRRPPPQRRQPATLPFTTPVTLSGWLIGGGSLLAAIGVLVGLFDGFLNPIDLLLLLALLAIAATVFFSANIPNLSNLRIITLVVVLIAFGMGLDRIGFGAAGVDALLLFLGAAAASIGAILLELGKDQPLGPSHG